MLVGSEFNGAAPFLKELNGGPDDLIPGVEMMAIRSDKNDKYSQPDAPLRRPARQADRRGLRRLGAARRAQRDHRRARSSRDGVPQARLRRAVPVHHRQGRRHPVHHPGAEADAERPGHRHGRRALHQPSGRRRRRRHLRGRSQDRRAQDAAAGASQDDRRRRPVGPVHRQLRRLLTNSCCTWRASRSPTPIARPSCARATWCICGPSRSPRPTSTPPPSW